MERSNGTLREQIAEREQAIAAQKRAEHALRDADRRKDEFLATLAHELRNPLAPVRHATHVLGQSQLDSEQQRWARAVITRQIDHMAVLLDDLLDVSRITRGRLELRRERASLQDIVGNAVETARPILEDRSHALRVDLSAASMVLFVDPLRLAQALSNLLVNAAKYTDPGGHIELTARRDESGVMISVTDNGIGLTAESLSNIFEMFSQVDSALGRSEGGLGIGLALVKGLVELHDGKIDASSPGLGFGSTFTLHLPESCLIEASTSPRTPGELFALGEFQDIGSATSRAQRILVADDNRDAAEALSMLLRFAGHEIVTVHAGLDVLPAMERHEIDACILDIGMPDLNGYEVARRIRATPGFGHVLLIALTGWGQQRDVERAREAGFDRHFTKPVDGADLEAVLAEPRASRRAEREGEVTSPGAAAAEGHAPL
jgi:CheY-like chemotaxis protein